MWSQSPSWSLFVLALDLAPRPSPTTAVTLPPLSCSRPRTTRRSHQLVFCMMDARWDYRGWNPLLFCTLFLSVNFYCLLRFFLLFSEYQLTLSTNFDVYRVLLAYRHNEQLHLVAVHRYMPLELLCCYTFWMFLPPPPSRVDPLCQLPLSLKSRPREWSSCHWETLQPPIHPLPAKSLALRWDLPVSTSLAPLASIF